MAHLRGKRTIRWSAATVALATGVSLLAPQVVAAQDASSDIQLATQFIEKEFATNGLIPGPAGTPDIGLNQDLLLSLKALDPDSPKIDAAYTAIAPELEGYVSDSDHIFSDRLAKTVAFQDALGIRNADFIAQLVSAVQENGQIKNLKNGEATSAINNFSQAWGVLALHRVGETEAAERATDFLKTQVCSDGGVQLASAIEPKCKTTDSDVTAMAAQALTLANGAQDPTTQATLDYLVTTMDETGGVKNTWTGVNSNSTGLVGSAFALAGDEENYLKAREYLASVQFGEDSDPSIQGGFAFTVKAKETTTAISDQIRRATGQAALGFAGGNYANDKLITIANPVDPTPDPEIPTPPADSEGSTGGIGGAGIIIAILAILAAIAGVMGPMMANLQF
ncbi:prenyltransferase/squalene oxidase repeat-containing protein [Corynebacterium glutamicum]|uniref:prenyltransferase/squalene oxidase repeat-containing protein n=1 Tax=Corynebacterium glutamicum TaxID=1718 RepID=UPI001181677E|nr:prenyltransferase/squalene oxidase repeat-containing protein [Corynebacterium glutamicum]QDQ20125.1 terpene cyclase/mutase family protein [Corynebacterium glutamicum]QDQ23692.1 terpene cyclase/mutase family protein [Corynebacterium glutamicum]